MVQSQGYPPRLVDMVREQHPVTVERCAHPAGGDGWCSNCGGKAPEGVKLTRPCGAFFFFCMDCATRVAEVLPR